MLARARGRQHCRLQRSAARSFQDPVRGPLEMALPVSMPRLSLEEHVTMVKPCDRSLAALEKNLASRPSGPWGREFPENDAALIKMRSPK